MSKKKKLTDKNTDKALLFQVAVAVFMTCVSKFITPHTNRLPTNKHLDYHRRTNC